MLQKRTKSATKNANSERDLGTQRGWDCCGILGLDCCGILKCWHFEEVENLFEEQIFKNEGAKE